MNYFYKNLKQSFSAAIIFLSTLVTGCSQSHLAHDFMEGKSTVKPLLFRFSTLKAGRELIIKEPSEVDALAVVFQRSDDFKTRVMTAFDMEITFVGGQKVSYRIYTAQDEQMGLVVSYPLDDGTGDEGPKNVRINPKEIPESLHQRLSSFGLLP